MNLGQLGEDMVAEFYQKQGFKIVDRNYTFPKGLQAGELDLVAVNNNELVFIEVKTRRSQRFGSALEAVDIFKQRKLVKTSKFYLRQHPQYQAYNYRIDVAVVDIDNPAQPVIIIPNAIEDM